MAVTSTFRPAPLRSAVTWALVGTHLTGPDASIDLRDVTAVESNLMPMSRSRYLLAVSLTASDRTLKVSTVATLGSTDAHEAVRLLRAILLVLHELDPARVVRRSASRVLEWAFALVGAGLIGFAAVQFVRVMQSPQPSTFGYGLWSVFALVGLGLLLAASPWQSPATLTGEAAAQAMANAVR